jgi:hypothetical protein
MTKLRGLKVPSPAMAVACIALAVALSGTGYAVTQLPRGSVGTAQLRNNAVISSKVKDRSLRARDFALGQLPAVVARARNVDPITTVGTNETNWPLRGNSWTQAANETNEFLAEVTVAPAGCTTGSADLTIFLDGERLVGESFFDESGTFRLNSRYRLDPGAAVTHQLTARVQDSCSAANQDYAFSNLKINVLASR